MTRLAVAGVIHKLTVDEFVDCTNTLMTCCGENLLSPKCRNYSRDPDQAHSGRLILRRANPYTEFEVPSVSRSGDISWGVKF